MEGKEIAKQVLWLLGIIVLYLGYFLDLSSKIETILGLYYKGVSDGVIIVLTFLAVVFYSSSFLNIDRKQSKKSEDKNERKKSSQIKPPIIKVDPKLVQEIIDKVANLDAIFHKVIERAGGIDVPFRRSIPLGPEEENEFRKNIDWLAENYPPISAETSMVLRQVYYDPIRGIKIPDYDPLLQIIPHNSLKILCEQPTFILEEFETNLQGSRTKLHAFLGSLKKK